MVSWNRIQELINDVESVSKTTEKMEKVSSFKDLLDLFHILYTNNTTGLTKAGILKFKKEKYDAYNFTGTVEQYEDSPLKLLNDLAKRQLSGHDAKYVVAYLLDRNPEYADAITRVACGNLKLRLQTKQLNKIFPGLFPEFSVALAEDFAKRRDHFLTTLGEKWFASRKFDGVRCLTIVTPDSVKCYSRVGNHFPALKKLEEYIYHQGITPDFGESYVLDGEICVVNDGVEDFSAAVSQVKRKSVVMENVKYYCFDIISLDVFNGRAKPTLKFSSRQRILTDLIGRMNPDQSVTVIHVRQIPIDSEEHLNQLMSDATDNSYEGLILRKNGCYEGRRSKNLLKMKKFSREEYIVEEVQFSEMQIVDPVTKNPVVIEILQSVGIRHKDNIVFVGSGFTVEQRQHYREHPEDIMGQTISVQYFEESQDLSGKISLRFPTVKGIYGSTRDC